MLKVHSGYGDKFSSSKLFDSPFSLGFRPKGVNRVLVVFDFAAEFMTLMSIDA